MVNTDSVFITLLKEHTTIDTTFINTFFKKFKVGGELDFDIKDINVAKYLDVNLINIRKRLNNMFTKTKKFIKNVDYIKIKSTNANASITYMLNYQCFEKLAMSGDSSKSELVREYFTKLRDFMYEHQELIYQAITNKNDLNKYRGFNSIYFFAADERKPGIFKIGRTQDIIQRLRNYNVGRIKEVDLKYYALVNNAFIIEKCIKFKLEKNRVIDGREIYKVDANKLKKIIDDCYCKYVSKKENEELYKEISDLLGLYAYTKNKVHIKPYIIIRD